MTGSSQDASIIIEERGVKNRGDLFPNRLRVCFGYFVMITPNKLIFLGHKAMVCRWFVSAIKININPFRLIMTAS